MQKTKDKVTFKGNPVTLLGNPIEQGDEAPDFTVLDTGLSPKKLSDYNGKVRILSVFLSIDTGPCSNQTRKFNEEAAKLGDDVTVLTISNDLPFALARFCGAEGIDNVETLSDHKDLDFGTKYGFLVEEFRLLARGVVIVDKDNIVQYVEYVPEISEEPDYESALEAVRKLK
jgi:thiol peroxidase